MLSFTVPDICDTFDDLKIGDLFLNSYGGNEKFYGQIITAKCEHSNSVVKDIVKENGKGKVLLIEHTGSKLCSMVGDQIVNQAFDNKWNGIITNGHIRDIEIIKDIEIGVYAKNSFPLKTDKSRGVGIINVPVTFGSININTDDWIYVDANGWVVSSSELKF